MKNISKKVVEKIKIHILYSVICFESLSVYKITSKNVVDPMSSHMTIWRMGVACWISRATRAEAHTHVLVQTHTRALVYAIMHMRALTHGNM